jgi:TPP-dependent trihydroxycyclohexane-1,2-dione (THcHDO) dehydratase
MAGRPEEAIGAMRTALDLDPLSPIINEDFGDATVSANDCFRPV